MLQYFETKHTEKNMYLLLNILKPKSHQMVILLSTDSNRLQGNMIVSVMRRSEQQKCFG